LLAYQNTSPIKPKFPIQNLQLSCNEKISSSLLTKEKAVTCWSAVKVQPFPPNIPRQRTCFEVNNEIATTVARRISNSNRIRSIETDYDNESAIVDCTASRNTKYRIQLHYKNEAASSSPRGNSIIIVQVQRRSGCSLIFQKEYRSIFHAAKHNKIVEPDDTVSNRVINHGLSNIPDIPLEDGILEQSLQNAQSHLVSDVHNARMLGLELVVSIINPHISTDDVARNVSKMIMMDETYIGIRESIASLIYQKDEEDDFFFEEAKYIRSLALTILATAISTLSRENILTNFIRDEQWCTLSLIPVLLEDIKKAAKHQYNASLAAKCLLILFKDSEEARSKAGRDALSVLESAKHVGRLSHARLEKEAQGAMDEMMMIGENFS